MRQQAEQDGMAGRETAAEGCTMKPDGLEHRQSGITAKSPTEWIAEIQRHVAQETSSIIDLAIVICAARSKLYFGQWAEIWESERLPFGKRKAEKLVVVGKGLGWLDAIDRSHLPSALRTLYWLARLERPTLRDLLADGTIHPGMSEREARELLVKFQGLRENPRKVNVRQRLQRFANFVRETVSDWNFEEREEAKTELSRLIEHFESWPSLAPEARLSTSRGAALDEFSWRVGPRFTFKPNQPE